GKQDDAGEPPATNIQQQDALSQKKTESGDSSTDAGDEANAAGSEDKGDVEAKPSDDLVINPLDNQKKEKKSKEENL
ncbi:MAG: hypothetical protein GWO38_26350, partial [Phycisphaerae bacterium]|nr:hypothetical protein [Phycisphaerae bacterium]NIX31054.1 hypothetical protein [Phycisphaerae bacterium]